MTNIYSPMFNQAMLDSFTHFLKGVFYLILYIFCTSYRHSRFDVLVHVLIVSFDFLFWAISFGFRLLLQGWLGSSFNFLLWYHCFFFLIHFWHNLDSIISKRYMCDRKKSSLTFSWCFHAKKLIQYDIKLQWYSVPLFYMH